ncbi:(2Fe-2S)-binding protein [Fontivita pretiosa]|uniref:(2Fe-2S)-binding protein n=1 Tax=Fontivita pretiosa TaxID=2989684 RepID=UPI003D18018E
MASETFNFQVNGKAVTVTTERDRSLLEVLREDLKLTGTKYGCGEGACGACTVLIDGAKTLSCSTIVAEADGKSITTIEGLAKGQVLHPVQQAFLECEGFQCGYCTAGMIMGTVALLEKTPNPTGSEIEQAMNGHLCRCCSYPNILRSIRRAIELTAGRRE